MTDRTHDPELRSWVESANVPDCDFPVQNLPFGTFRMHDDSESRVGVAIGDQVLDVSEAFGIIDMNSLMAMPARDRQQLRERLSSFLVNYTPLAEQFLYPSSSVDMLLPCEIGDYTDFYASIHHATNVGRMFRPDNPLMPNYKWMPIAYHGRSSSIVVSGTPVRRPSGQLFDKETERPVYGPSRLLDYELEVGAFLGPGSQIGHTIPIAGAEDHFFGVCLLNDWSARDIQTWEYQPLGPFLAKNFATSISPWIVTREALAPFRRALPARSPDDPEPLPHLKTDSGAYAITLEVWLRSAKMPEPVRLSRSDFSTLYWSLSQMIAHHTSNGCPIRPGDLIGSGTVSGPEKDNRGCLLELTSRGAEPVQLPDGETRKFLQDGDEVILRGWCEHPSVRRIGLGECRGIITSANSFPSE